MTVEESRKIEGMRLDHTNDFMIEIAKVFSCKDMDEAAFRLNCIEDEVSGWACDDEQGAWALINSARELIPGFQSPRTTEVI